MPANSGALVLPGWVRPWLALALALSLGALPVRAAEAAPEPAPEVELEVRGMGWLRNREYRRSLARLLDLAGKTELGAAELDDAVFLLHAMLTEQGFLNPDLLIRVRSPGGVVSPFEIDATLEARWPQDLRAASVEIEVNPGVRYLVREVRFSGLDAIPRDLARSYFRGERALLVKSGRAYSPARSARGRDNLEAELNRRGYAEARVAEPIVHLDARTGAVELDVHVEQGRLWTVRAVQVRQGGGGAQVPGQDLKPLLGRPWSQLWQQDLLAALRSDYFKAGYPDVTFEIRPTPEPEAGGVAVGVEAEVVPGEQVRIEAIRFQGKAHTRDEVITRRVDLEAGDLLNPLELEQSRYRMARLGVFESVNLHYEPSTGPLRSPVYTVREGRRIETNLLAGYGSYEELRGGIEVKQYNLWGAAHQSRLLLVQSAKSSRLDYSYSVPELFGEFIDANARLFGLQRDEFSFVRQEYGGSLQLKSPIQRLGVDATVGYTFQALRNTESALGTSGIDDRQLIVASLEAGVVRDRRDNPLRPTDGYRLFARAESADPKLGGAVQYQRFELGGALHRRIRGGMLLHAGLSHGLITTFGTDDLDLPVNKRFFPGGDGSIRGYREGEAAPRGPDGRFVGAKTYALVNLELEQAVTRNLAAIFFTDFLGSSARLAEYPFAEKLVSAGVGLRYHTLIGPVRAEYGHNLHRRAADPAGTWHISVGFPF